MTLLRWQRPESPVSTGWDDLSRLRDEIGRLFESPFGVSTRGFNLWAPTVDIYETNDQFILKAEVPGMKKDEIDVSLHDNAVTISGERKGSEQREDVQTHRSERFYGRFQRTMTLPVPVAADKVKASYSDGILTVTLPKSDEAKPRHIEINVK